LVNTAAATRIDPPALATPTTTQSAWRSKLPVLCAGNVTLRELRLSDAQSLHQLLTTEEVSRFISPPPTTVAGFERFIEWTHRQRAAGEYVCFAVVPDGFDDAVGLFQIRQLEPSFAVAEWGFAIGERWWGTGVFANAAPVIVDFAIEILQVRRLEARATVQNARGNGALQKIGAMPEAVLRKAFLKEGVYYDQVLWSICADDWRLGRAPLTASVH
jgi:[ribosomal protein S5]-alanine N-acetyltransferase